VASIVLSTRRARGSTARRSWRRCLVFACALAVPAHALAQDRYAALVEAARAGNYGPALTELQSLHRAHTATPAQLADLALIEHWAGRHQEALSVMHEIAAPPEWLWLPMARSALALRKGEQARALAERAPVEGDAAFDRAAALADADLQQGRLGQACRTLDAVLPGTPDEYRAAMAMALFSRADCLERRGDLVNAASTYAAIARLMPKNARARREEVFALRKAGATPLAWDLAQNHLDLFSGAELAELAHERQAMAIRHGEVLAQVGTPAEAFAGLDRALRLNDAALAAEADEPAMARRTRYDRFLALRDARAMGAAVSAWESAPEAERDLAPAYVRAGVADAYLYLEKPRQAQRLYEEAIAAARADDNAHRAPTSWRVGLYYALLESEQPQAAAREIDALLAQTPHAVHSRTPGLESANDDYLQVRLLHALHRYYTDQLPAAERELRALREAVPFSSAVRAAWVSLLSSRDQPRVAYDEARRLQIDDPDYHGAEVLLSGLAFDLQRWKEARDRLSTLIARNPDDKALQRQQDAMRRHDAWTLRVESLVTHTSGPDPKEPSFLAQLYGPPLAENWRPFFFDAFVPANAREGAPLRNRVGAGVEWREGDWTASADVGHDNAGVRRESVELRLARALSDHHQVALDYQNNTRELSVRAFVNGIYANSLGGAYTYSRNESRKWIATLRETRFSDGNRRGEAGVEWRERLHADARWRVDASLAAGATRNSEDDRPYFNPRRDESVQAGAAAERLEWREYARAFRQRLAGSVGLYHQAGFRALPYGEVRYSHEWDARDAWNVVYGVGYAVHPYDGVQERAPFAFLTLAWYPR
jgi:biofilm PGA synthesis protein PgaA